MTKRALEILRIMRDGEGDILSAGMSTVHELLKAKAITITHTFGGLESYTINETGRKLLEERPNV